MKSLKKQVIEIHTELSAHRKHHEKIIKNLRSTVTSFFMSHEAVYTFVEQCIIPRLQNSPADALYCFKFVLMLQRLQTKNFNTLMLIDCSLKKISAILFCSTRNECDHLGIFLRYMVEQIDRWLFDPVLFKKDVFKTPGFVHKYPEDGIELKDENYLNFQLYQKAMQMWKTTCTR